MATEIRPLNVDSRGVHRGKCETCYNCSGYQSKKGLLCDVCHHPPAKHLKNPTTTHNDDDDGGGKTKGHSSSRVKPGHGDTSSKVTLYDSDPCHSNPDSNWPCCVACGKPVHYDPSFGFFKYCSSGCRDEHLLPDYNLKLQSIIDSICPKSQSSGDWPCCSACNKPVHHDGNFGFFKYCSPGCRDEHLLPGYNTKLEDDIKRICPIPTTHQQIVQVELELKPSDKLPLILQEEKDEQGNTSIVIVGAKDEKSVDWLCRHLLFLLDSISGGKAILDNSFTPFSSCDDVYKFTNPRTKFQLTVNRRQAIQYNIDAFYEKVKNEKVNAVFRLRTDSLGRDFKVDSELKVIYVDPSSDANRLGLKYDDKIAVYAPVSDCRIFEVIHPTYKHFKTDMASWLNSGQHVYFLLIGVVRI